MTDVKSIPATPLSRKEAAEAVKAILEARKTVKVEVPVVTVTAKDVDKAHALPEPSKITAQSLTEAPAKGALVTAPTEIPDDEVTPFLEQSLPQLAEMAQLLFQKPFSFSRALTLAPRLMEMVSFVVATGIPAMKKLEAKALVIVIFRWLFRRYVAPSLGAFATILEPLVLKGLEALYQATVKKQAQRFLADPETKTPYEYAQASLLG